MGQAAVASSAIVTDAEQHLQNHKTAAQLNADYENTVVNINKYLVLK